MSGYAAAIMMCIIGVLSPRAVFMAVAVWFIMLGLTGDFHNVMHAIASRGWD